MEKRAINEKTNKQRDYLTFLEQVLDVCLIFKKKLNSGYKRVFFREKNADHDWYETQGEGWGNLLSACVFHSIISGENILEISDSKDNKKRENISLKTNLSIRPVNIKNITQPENDMQYVLTRLQGGFLDDRIIRRLIDQSIELFERRRLLFAKESIFYLKENEIEDYLKAYYRLLLSCIIYYDIFDQQEERDNLFDILLHLDTELEEDSDNYQLSFWSPIVLNKFQKTNYGVELFFEEITKEKASQNEMLQRIYKRALLTKVQHSFRWYIPGKNRELLHATIPPYVKNMSGKLMFQVIARSLKEYNSYEGIGELRLGEKIIYEYKFLEKSDRETFCVAIMGDLHQKPIEELYDYVIQKLYFKCQNTPRLIFHIYTRNKVDEDFYKNQDIIYGGSPEQILLNKNELGKVIDNNHVVFILDCVELYRSPTVLEKENLEFIKQKYAFSAYDEYNTGDLKNIDICDSNALEELYEIMTCEQCFKQFGRVAKPANEFLLEFCEKKQKERGTKSVIYIYVSDLQAFSNIYSDDQYYIRTERYHQKEIGIIRYSSEEVTELAVSGNDKMLVFNIWQFIKTIAIEEKDIFLHIKGITKCDYRELDRIYIGIDYADWPNRLIIHYFSEDKRYEQVAKKVIKDILLPILNNHNKDMFHMYIKKAMYSFFYSAAKSVDDMLFIHLFQDKENLLGEVIFAEENDQKKVERNINKDFKYSSKRFYDMIMKNYDISSSSYMGQMKTSQIIQKNEKKNIRIVKRDIYNNVIEACKNLSYEDGYLSENCRMEIV